MFTDEETQQEKLVTLNALLEEETKNRLVVVLFLLLLYLWINKNGKHTCDVFYLLYYILFMKIAIFVITGTQIKTIEARPFCFGTRNFCIAR